jgi:hypothetical protein
VKPIVRRARLSLLLPLFLFLLFAAPAEAQNEPCASCEETWKALPPRIVPVPLYPRPQDSVWLDIFDPSRHDPLARARVVVRQQAPTARVVPTSVSKFSDRDDTASVTFLLPLSPGTYVVDYFEPGTTSTPGEVPKASLRFVVSDTGPVEVVEYFNAALGHYFMTADAAEIEKLDTGAIPGWQRTGESFHALPPGELPSFGLPVCRFYGLPSAGLDSHFFSASGDECAAVKEKWPNQWMLETEAAFGAIDDLFPFENCTPLYRLYNDRPDANHRYTTSTAIRDRMLAEGWILEAAYDARYEDAFSMCVLP